LLRVPLERRPVDRFRLALERARRLARVAVRAVRSKEAHGRFAHHFEVDDPHPLGAVDRAVQALPVTEEVVRRLEALAHSVARRDVPELLEADVDDAQARLERRLAPPWLDRVAPPDDVRAARCES